MTKIYTPSERRKRRRIPLDDRLICFKFYNYEGTLKTEDLPLFIGMKDISYGGLGGMCNHKCELGDHMFINLVVLDEKVEFELIVAWCKNKGHVYEVGFSFINLTEYKVRFLDRYIQRIIKRL